MRLFSPVVSEGLGIWDLIYGWSWGTWLWVLDCQLIEVCKVIEEMAYGCLFLEITLLSALPKALFLSLCISMMIDDRKEKKSCYMVVLVFEIILNLNETHVSLLLIMTVHMYEVCAMKMTVHLYRV